jgi:hypothetical protein
MRVAAWIIVAVIRAVAWTLRYRLNDRSEYLNRAPAGPAICCVWHNRLVLCIPIYRSHVSQRNANAGIAAMVSASKDGGFLTGILECLKVEPVRGSSSRRGPQALLEMITWAERGYDVALTPDGPRGPRYVVQEGVMALAQLTGLPVLPCSYNLDWKLQLQSWDRFQIPLPFSRCEINFGPVIRVPREATDGEREALRQELEASLRRMSRD